MLVLTRRIGETVSIGDDIVVKVVRVEAGQVRLGIEAPSRVLIRRSEVAKRITSQEYQPRLLGTPQ